MFFLFISEPFLRPIICSTDLLSFNETMEPFLRIFTPFPYPVAPGCIDPARPEPLLHRISFQ